MKLLCEWCEKEYEAKSRRRLDIIKDQIYQR